MDMFFNHPFVTVSSYHEMGMRNLLSILPDLVIFVDNVTLYVLHKEHVPSLLSAVPCQRGHRLSKGMRVLSRVPAAGSPTNSPTELDPAAWKRISLNLALLLQTPSLVGLSIPDIFRTNDSEELNSISGLS